MKLDVKCLFLTLLLIVPLLSTAAPVNISLSNPGFESPTLTTQNGWYNGVSGWIYSGSIGTTYDQPWITPYPCTQGNQYLYAAVNGSGTSWGFNISQTHMTTIQSATFYQLKFDVYPLAATNSRIGARLLEMSAGEELASVYYRPPWLDDQLMIDLTPNQWNTVTVEFNSADFSQYIGNALGLFLMGDQIALDNITLTAESMIGSPGNTTYYISSSAGNDSNNGLSASTPWQSFAPIRLRFLLPGDKVLLKRGDTWVDQQLHLRGDGSASQPIELSSYGTGNRPIIKHTTIERPRCIVVESPHHWKISDMDCRSAKLGLYLRYYRNYMNQNVTIENCHFQDFDSWTANAPSFNNEYAFNTGLFIGGSVYQSGEYWNVLDGLTIRGCSFENCTAGLATNFYFPAQIRDRIKNVLIEDCYATQVSAGGLCLHNVSNAMVRRFQTFGKCGKTADFTWGSTGGIIHSSQNITLDDCEFSETDRMFHNNQEGDGSGLDIDGNNINITVKNTVFHDNEGPGLLFLSTYAPNNSITVEDCVFYNNGTDAAVSFDGNAYSIKASNNTTANSVFRNLKLYRSSVAWDWIFPNNAPQGVSLQNISYDSYSSVSSRPAPVWEWNTVGNLEGWNNFNQWDFVQANYNVLLGQSSGVDPFAHSPNIFANKHETSHYVKINMVVYAGTSAMIFFTTETDQTWSIDKSVTFPVIADGQWHEYVVDLRNSPNYKGVINQLRLDPTDASGSVIYVDYVRYQ